MLSHNVVIQGALADDEEFDGEGSQSVWGTNNDSQDWAIPHSYQVCVHIYQKHKDFNWITRMSTLPLLSYQY